MLGISRTFWLLVLHLAGIVLVYFRSRPFIFRAILAALTVDRSEAQSLADGPARLVVAESNEILECELVVDGFAMINTAFVQHRVRQYIQFE